MEMCVDFVLKFKEAMSILTDTTNAPINVFDGGAWKSSNLLSGQIKTICENAFEWDFTDQSEKAFQNVPFVEWDSVNSTWKFKKLFLDFTDYLFKEHKESYCVTAKDDTTSELVSVSTSLLDNLFNLLFDTYEKYEQMFKYYSDLKNKLMEGVKSNSKTSAFNKFKDTPQGAVTLANLGDDYNTNVSINQNEYEFEDGRDTPVSRLEEIESKLNNLYGLWAYDFRMFFWEV